MRIAEQSLQVNVALATKAGDRPRLAISRAWTAKPNPPIGGASRTVAGSSIGTSV